MAANSWMQHPVGYTIDPTTGRPGLNDIGAVFTNPVFLWGYVHVLARVARHRRARDARRCRPGTCAQAASAPALPAHRQDSRSSCCVPGDHPEPDRRQQARRHRDDVPADEDRGGRGAVGRPASRARSRCSRSAAATTTTTPTKIIADPAPALGARDRQLGRRRCRGSTSCSAQYEQQYGPGNYIPNVFVQYWSMRVMAYLGALVVAVRAVGRVADLARAS